MNEPLSTRPSITTVQNLGLNRNRGLWKWIRVALFLIAVVGLVIGVQVWRASARESEKPRYETAEVQRGDIEVTVNVTGTIESVDSVEIGAEVSGKVESVLVDFNDVVTKGQTLATINTEQLDASVKEARAKAAVSAAAVVSARATATESKADVQRMKSLADRGLISQKELDAAVATAARADAAVSTALAQQSASAASLESATSARDKAVVRSPIDGIVLSRSVEPGQTVAATLQAPVLFIVAKDLTSMCLKVEVDEADVGEVASGQNATFTVDAYPEKKFNAVVRFLKNMPTDGQDVVTYEAELTVDNKDRLLRPGMTATATIITSKRTNVLMVPNAALRFTPPEAAASSTAQKGGGPLPMFGPPPMPARSAAPVEPGNAGGGKVWVLENQVPTAKTIKIGKSDGSSTEVVDGALQEGAAVLVDIVTLTE